MVSRRSVRIIFLCASQAILFWATAYVPGFGARGWHHVASLIATLVICAAFWRPLNRSRRFLAIGVLVFTVLAAASGFWLLYWKEGIRAAGYQDWGVFWHVAWSWAASVFFFQHTWINRVAYGYYWRRSFASFHTAAVHVLGYALLVVAFFVTWSSAGKQWFTVESYIPLSFYAWLVLASPSYVGWLTVALIRDRLEWARRWNRPRLRGPVDLGLVAASALATISGVPLVWWDAFMDANGWKYVSKFWHVWPSVLFCVLVFVHSAHIWRTMKAHWRRFGIALGDVPPPRPGPVATNVAWPSNAR